PNWSESYHNLEDRVSAVNSRRRSSGGSRRGRRGGRPHGQQTGGRGRAPRHTPACPVTGHIAFPLVQDLRSIHHHAFPAKRKRPPQGGFRKATPERGG